MDQDPVLAGVIRESFKVITKETLFTNAFPPIESRFTLTRHCLYTATKIKMATVVKKRVKTDDNFVRSLQDLVSLSSSLLLLFLTWFMMLSGNSSCRYASDKYKGFSCQGHYCWI